jgi:hypothetical protein
MIEVKSYVTVTLPSTAFRPVAVTCGRELRARAADAGGGRDARTADVTRERRTADAAAC